MRPLAIFTHHLRRESSPRLGEIAQGGQVHGGEPHIVEQVEAVGNPGKAGRAFPPEKIPEGGLDHTELSQNHRRATCKMRMKHRKAKAVMERKRCNRPLIRPKL